MPPSHPDPIDRPMSWIVVPIAEAHIEGFCHAVDRVAREREYLAFTEGPPLERSRAFVLRNLQENQPHFVALVEEDVVGWCDISSVDRPVYAHIGVLGMGVVAEYRGRGIGEALIRAALDKARSAGLERVELTVRESNMRARKLYEKVGFITEGVNFRAVKIAGRYENRICMAILFDDGDSSARSAASDSTIYIAEFDEAPPELLSAVDAGLEQHNYSAAPLHGVQPLAAIATGDSAQVVGGAVGRTWGTCCELLQLWVEPAYRGNGLALQLVQRFERRAAKRGCSVYYLTTLSYQAPDLYRKLGYAVLAEISGYPNGIIKYLMHKITSPSGAREGKNV